jgi:hypothetical protein
LDRERERLPLDRDFLRLEGERRPLDRDFDFFLDLDRFLERDFDRLSLSLSLSLSFSSPSAFFSSLDPFSLVAAGRSGVA